MEQLVEQGSSLQSHTYGGGVITAIREYPQMHCAWSYGKGLFILAEWKGRSLRGE